MVINPWIPATKSSAITPKPPVQASRGRSPRPATVFDQISIDPTGGSLKMSKNRKSAKATTQSHHSDSWESINEVSPNPTTSSITMCWLSAIPNKSWNFFPAQIPAKSRTAQNPNRASSVSGAIAHASGTAASVPHVPGIFGNSPAPKNVPIVIALHAGSPRTFGQSIRFRSLTRSHHFAPPSGHFFRKFRGAPFAGHDHRSDFRRGYRLFVL